MLRDLYERLHIKYEIWRYHRKRDQQPDPYDQLTDDEQAAVQTVETLKALHPGVDVQAWFRKAIHTEAFTTPEPLLQIIHQVHASGRLTTEDINQIASHGIKLDFGGHYDKIQQAARLHRLQNAVRQLAFIAGPGFTTDHLIDEGIVKQGDL